MTACQAPIRVFVSPASSISSALKDFTLDPRTRRIGLLNSSDYFGSDFEQVGGYFRVTSNVPVFSYALFGGARFLSAIEGQAPTGE